MSESNELDPPETPANRRSSACWSLRSWWQRLWEPRIDNDITRNSAAICRLAKKIKQGEAEVLADIEAGKYGFPRMIVCETCGNKRCPHATDKRNECTNSNEPGQKGSRYE